LTDSRISALTWFQTAWQLEVCFLVAQRLSSQTLRPKDFSLLA